MSAAAEQAPKQPLSPLSSDSVDLAEFLAANRRRPPGWIDAVGRVVSPSPQNPPSALTSVNPENTTMLTARGEGSSPGELTPATSRYPAEATAMGSPIPVDTDDSDANIQHLISRLGARGEVLLSPPVGVGAAAGGAAAYGDTTLSTLPPSPAPAGAVPLAMAPPTPRTAAGLQAAHPSTARSGAPPAAHPAPSSSARQQMALSANASSSLLPSPSNVAEALQHSPFGASYNTSGSLDPTALALQRGDAHHTRTTVSDTLQHLTTYSSALMQALSRSEGAAVLSSQWASTVHPSRTGTADDDDSQGSTAYPPDIYEEAMRAKVAKQQWMALERARQEVLEEARRRRDCPFAPQVSPFAARMQRPASLRPENRVRSEVIRRKQWMAVRQQAETERELKDCTFRPLTVRAAKLDPAALTPPGPAVFHHLYAEAEDRRAFAAEVKPLVVQQAEGRHAPSSPPLREEQLAEVVERLCARGVVQAAAAAAEPPVEGGEGGEAADGAPRPASPSPSESHQPLLSAVSQRIVAAQVAAGERDPDVVQHLYRQAERDAMRDQLKVRLIKEQARVARAEEAMALAHDRRRLQQEHYRSMLAAKYRALSRHVCATQRTSYRASAPQSVALLARAAFDLLSIEETEELLTAVEDCGQHKLREAEFIAVVFRYFAEVPMPVRQAALLTRPPPSSTVGGGGGAPNAKRAGSAPTARSGGGGGSLDGSPLSLPRVKREKLDAELIAQIRESRAQALEEWKQEHQRQRAVAEGLATDDNHSFQPAPRRLIPYACRPDVVVPVKMTKSEALRRAHIAARHTESGAAAPPSLPQFSALPTAAVHSAASAATTTPTENASTARELFSRLATSEAVGSQSSRSHGPALGARSRSGGAAVASSGTQREGSATASCASPAPQPQSRAASVSTRGPSRSPPQAPTAKPTPTLVSTAKPHTIAPSSHRAPAPQPTTSSRVHARWAAARPPPPHAPAAVPVASRDAVFPVDAPKPREAVCCVRGAVPPSSPSFVDQIMQSTPEERARLGRELLLRQLREHQRKRGS